VDEVLAADEELDAGFSAARTVRFGFATASAAARAATMDRARERAGFIGWPSVSRAPL
jgi:hypothetical protein